MKVKIVKLYPNARIPTRATRESACYDIYSSWGRHIHSKETNLIKTGLQLEIPEGYFLDIRPRSGLAKKGVFIANSPGTLDSDYRGELLVLLYNSTERTILIRKGDRVAQCTILPIVDIEFEEVKKLRETERGEGGFGSTGR